MIDRFAILRRAAIAAVVALLAAVAIHPVHAQQPALLTESQVTGFIASYPEIVALSEEFQNEAPPPGDDATAALGALATYQGAVARLNETVGAHGFADYTEWMTVAGSITTAYTFARQGGAMDEQMQAAIAGIEANPNLSGDQKKMLLQQLQQAAASVSAQRPPQENIDLVNAHADELEMVLNRD